MLRDLHISDLGVIDDLDLELHRGLNVLTGETGTGKTLVTVALQLALGRRASASLVRPGASAARVQARFDAPQMAKTAGWGDEDELVLARTITAEGRSTARVDGQLAPVSTLAELAGSLVEVHGQHDGQRLMSTAEQTRFLDRFAGARHRAAVEALREELERLRAIRAVLRELDERERDRERQMDLLAYQVREIEAVAPRPGESEELQLEEARLAHAERLLERAWAAERLIGTEGGAADALHAVSAELRSAGEVDPGAAELADMANELSALASELAVQVRYYRERLEIDPGRLEWVRERFGALASLQRKYGHGEQAVLAFRESAARSLQALAGAEHERGRAVTEVEERAQKVAALAVAVSDGRTRAAPQLTRALRSELAELGMEGATIEVTLVSNDEVSGSGSEHAEFVFSGAREQAVHVLSKVASGGELSRTMLACRSVLVDVDDVPTLIFDEVDAGIGGRAGVAVGRRLAKLAQGRQVVVVTHLPQIASFADRHVRVRKDAGTASVEVLDDDDRVEELSRMLAGLPGSETAAAHAEELLAEAGRARGPEIPARNTGHP